MKRFIVRFLYILASEEKKLILLMIAIALTSVLEAFGIGMIGPFIALVNDPSIIDSNGVLRNIYHLSGTASKSSFISLLAGMILLVLYIKSFFNYKVREYIFFFSLSNQGELRSKLLNAYLNAPYSFHLQNNTAFLIQNIISETGTFCRSVLMQILNSAVSIVILLALIGLLLITDAVATFVISLILLIAFAGIAVFRKKLVAWGKASSESQAEMIRLINHSLGGLKETRIIGCEPYFEQQFSIQANLYAEVCSNLMSFGTLPRTIIEVLVFTFVIGMALVSLLAGHTENLVATLGIFGIVAIRLMPVATQLASGLTSLRSTAYVVDKLYNDLKEIENIQSNLDLNISHSVKKDLRKEAQAQYQSEILPFNKKILIEKISFRYNEASQLALQEINLTLHKGEAIALIGKSGAGKTTLVDLLLGLLTPVSGDIKVDGCSIYEDIRAWQNLIGYIPQSIFLIDDTLERNIAFGVPDHLIDSERLWRAVESAQLTELVSQLPDGLKTRVGERGICLSGGQRQRVGIARTLYHEREILVLDEATSALDNETEKLVTDSIKMLSGKKTMIIIAHRLSTVEHCDRIYLMDKGQIVKSGTYQEVVLSHSYSSLA